MTPRDAEPTGNRLLWGVLSFALAINLTLIGLMWSSLNARVDDHELRLRAREQNTVIMQIQEQISGLRLEMSAKFARIETSLDVLTRRPVERGRER